MRQYGKVIEICGNMARVSFKRTKACGNCKACFTLGSDEAVIEIVNSAGASAGDYVAIELHAKSMVKASLIMYGLPLIGLMLGVILGSLLSDIWAIVLGVLFSAAVYGIVHLFEPKLSKLNEFKPKMLHIITDENELNELSEENNEQHKSDNRSGL